MKILKKITTVVLSILLFRSPQLHTVDAIEISNKTKLNISNEINF